MSASFVLAADDAAIDTAFAELAEAGITMAKVPMREEGLWFYAVYGPAGRAAVEAAVKQAKLTPRELQVLRGMASGRSNSDIGSEHGLAEATIEMHALRLFRRLGVHHRAAAVAEGFRRGILGGAP